MVDLNQVAVARTLAGPGHDTRRNGNHPVTFSASEVNTIVPRLAAVEGVGAVPECRGHPAPLDRPAGQVHVAAHVTPGNEGFEHVQLERAVVEPCGKRVQLHGKCGTCNRLCRLILGPPDGWRLVEVKLAVIKVRHLSQVLPERVQADRARLQLSQAPCQSKQMRVRLCTQFFKRALLRGDIRCPFGPQLEVSAIQIGDG